MNKNAKQSTSVRPFFLAPEVNFDQLPECFKRAFTNIIEPLYRELVLECAKRVGTGWRFGICFLVNRRNTPPTGRWARDGPYSIAVGRTT